MLSERPCRVDSVWYPLRMITYITTFADRERADPGDTLCIAPRVNPALPLTDRYPQFRGAYALHEHVRAVRGGREST